MSESATDRKEVSTDINDMEHTAFVALLQDLTNGGPPKGEIAKNLFDEVNKNRPQSPPSPPSPPNYHDKPSSRRKDGRRPSLGKKSSHAGSYDVHKISQDVMSESLMEMQSSKRSRKLKDQEAGRGKSYGYGTMNCWDTGRTKSSERAGRMESGFAGSGRAGSVDSNVNFHLTDISTRQLAEQLAPNGNNYLRNILPTSEQNSDGRNNYITQEENAIVNGACLPNGQQEDNFFGHSKAPQSQPSVYYQNYPRAFSPPLHFLNSKSADINGNTHHDRSYENYSASKDLDKKRRKAAKKKDTGMVDSATLKGHRGNEDIDVLIAYIENNTEQENNKKNHSGSNSISTGVGGADRGKVNGRTNKREGGARSETKNVSRNNVLQKNARNSSTKVCKKLEQSASVDSCGSGRTGGSEGGRGANGSISDDDDCADDSNYDSCEDMLPAADSVFEAERNDTKADATSFVQDFYSVADAVVVQEDAEFRTVVKKKQKRARQPSRGGDRSSGGGRRANRGYDDERVYNRAENDANFFAQLTQGGQSDSRCKSTSSMPPSEHSDNSDIDSVHSLPVKSTTPKTPVNKTSSSSSSTPQASYADITRMASQAKKANRSGHSSRPLSVSSNPDVAPTVQSCPDQFPSLLQRKDASTSTAGCGDQVGNCVDHCVCASDTQHQKEDSGPVCIDEAGDRIPFSSKEEINAAAAVKDLAKTAQQSTQTGARDQPNTTVPADDPAGAAKPTTEPCIKRTSVPRSVPDVSPDVPCSSVDNSDVHSKKDCKKLSSANNSSSSEKKGKRRNKRANKSPNVEIFGDVIDFTFLDESRCKLPCCAASSDVVDADSPTVATPPVVIMDDVIEEGGVLDAELTFGFDVNETLVGGLTVGISGEKLIELQKCCALPSAKGTSGAEGEMDREEVGEQKGWSGRPDDATSFNYDSVVDYIRQGWLGAMKDFEVQ